MNNIADLLAFDRRHLWHPYSGMTNPAEVFPAVSASGTKIRLADGSELLDGVSSWWCMCHGHSHPKIVAALRAQAEKMPHVMFAGFTHEPAVRLTDLLIRRTPKGLDRVFYADSGSVSVECAMKLAVQAQAARGFSSRTEIATVRGGYHGDTTGAMSVCDPDSVAPEFRNLVRRRPFFAPAPEIPWTGVWKDSDFEPMERMLSEHENEIAAVIIEPVFQGGNRMDFYHRNYLSALRKSCTKHGIFLILDEVATGFGRLGTYFASELAGVVPDLMCVGKGLVGGATCLAGVVATEEIASAVSRNGGRFMHGPTFMANPLACAAGCASLELFDEYDWQGNVARIQSRLRTGLEECRSLPGVRGVRSLGAIGVVEVDSIPDSGTVMQIVRETGVWLRPFGNWIYTMPPFISTEEEVERMIAAMKRMCLAVGKKQ